jgi:hypothetical protein
MTNTNESRVGLIRYQQELNLCGGTIRTTGPKKWCTKLRDDCKCVSHDVKMNLKENHWYIKGGGGSARFEPSLNGLLSSVPEDQLDSLGAERRTPELWATYFRSILEHEIVTVSDP